MSVCDPASPDACDSCKTGEGHRFRRLDPGRNTVAMEDVTRRDDLEEMLGELNGLRLGARELKRSGNPAVRAEGAKALAHIEDQIRWVNAQLSKEDE